MTIDKIAIAICLSSIILLLIKMYIMNRTKKLLAADIIRITEEKMYISQAFQKLVEEQDRQALEKTDGFLKFVSESRDWAFAYIEDVQEKLSEFDSKMESIAEYYSVYGPDMQGVHVDLLKQVSEAYAELKSVLPKEQDKV